MGSREDAKTAKEINVEELSALAVDAAFHIHKRAWSRITGIGV
jgi:hypothetical protein